MTEQLQKKVDRAIRLIQSAGKMADKAGQPLEIAYSGGKDSDVILELAKMSGVNYKAIYKNTTIDPPGTIAHAKKMGVEVIRPPKTFFQLIHNNGLPTRMVRYCCKYLKEYKILDYAVIGVRREESIARKNRYHEPEVCRIYSKTSKARHYLPLLEWTSQDIASFITERGIKCHSLYYDEQGNFCPDRRLGCMACPLKKRELRLDDFAKYPNFAKQYIKAAKVYYDGHFRNRDRQGRKMFNDAYEWFTMMLFCDSITEFRERFGQTLFTPPHRLQGIFRELFQYKVIKPNETNYERSDEIHVLLL